MKIGILGGTFDPIHEGHLKLARAAIDNLGLDKLIFMPCSIPPHKNRKDITSSQDRLHMVKLAIEGQKRYILSDYEISRGGTSFSIEMLTDFKKTHPNDKLFFIIGSDSYKEFSTWRGHDQIPQLVKLAVAQRPSYAHSALDLDTLEIKMEPSSISSSEIRSKIKQGESIQNLVPDKVGDYIIKKKLYK